MKCSIALPGLIWPDIGDERIYNQISTPVLSCLIGRASLYRLDYSFSDLIYATYSDNEDLNATLATKLAKQLGVKADYPYFLIAEPTHLRIDRDRALICETEILKLSYKETQLIIDSINLHFKHEIKLYAFSNEFWLMGLNLDVSTNQFYPTLDILGENIDNYLPKSGSAIKLNRIINEIQMLLFNLPENLDRKKDGLLTINSLWLWDKTFNPAVINKYSEIYTNNKLVNLNNAKIKPLSPPYFKKPGLNNSLLIFDDLYYPCQYRDYESWVEKLNIISEHLFKELDVRQFSQIDLLIPSTNSTIGLRIKPCDKYKIWKKNLKLIDLFRKRHAL